MAAAHPQITRGSVGGGGARKMITPAKAAPSSTNNPPYRIQRPATPTGETGDDPDDSVGPVPLGGVAPRPKAKEPRARCPSTEEMVVQATV